MSTEITVSKMQDAENHNLDYNAFVRKSNIIITSKYKATLLENQLTSICLSRVKQQNGEYIATISANELKKLFSLNSKETHIYKKLFNAAQKMAGRTLAVENEDGNFAVISVIQTATYIDGIFSVRFNKDIKDYLFNLKERYTTYALSNVLSFTSDHSFRIYELIRKEAYRITKNNPVAVVEYGLSEFKCIIGVVDTSTEKIRTMMQQDFVDWDRIVEIAPEKTYAKWGNFRTRVLEVAKKEINAQCDMCFDYKPITSGRGGRVIGIRLYIQKNNSDHTAVDEIRKRLDEVNEDYEQTSLFKPSPELLKYIGHNSLKKKDINIFLEDAGGDNELVIRSIEKADEQPDIRNYVGWIRKCIRSGGYSDDTPVLSGSESNARFVEAIRKDVEDNKDEIAAGFWVKVRDKKSGKFPQFLEYLSQNGMDLTMFEAANTPAECANKFLDWSRGAEIDLI